MEPAPDPLPEGSPWTDDLHAADVSTYLCPNCGEPVESTAQTQGPFPVCPHCGEPFAISTGDEQADAEAEASLRARHEERERELDIVRIKQLSALRRADIRTRSYFLVGMILSFSIGGQLVLMTVQRALATHRLDLKLLSYILFALASVMSAAYFFRRAAQMTRELNQPTQQDPTTPPDFSTLSSGRDWRKDFDSM